MLRESSARKKFLERPAAIIPKDCIDCDYLSICHGGCPVRTYTFTGTMFEKDPYCHVYLALFRKAEEVAARLSAERAQRGELIVPIARKSCGQRRSDTNLAQVDGLLAASGQKLVQIERR